MVFFNYSTMQMAAKVVYYGPGLCGKTTNLQYIFENTAKDSRGEMVSLATETDRTLFFDLLPIDVGSIAGFSTRIQLYTVPGQVFYNTTRKLVLKGVDGVVFVVDSQQPMLQANLESFQNLEENLAEMGLSVDNIPVVMQYNKRDLPNICSVEELNQAVNQRGFPHVEASAINGDGVFETLKTVSKMTLLALKKRLTKGRDPRSSGSRPAMPPKPAAGAPAAGAPAAGTPAAKPPGAATTGSRPAAPAAGTPAAGAPAAGTPPAGASPTASRPMPAAPPKSTGPMTSVKPGADAAAAPPSPRASGPQPAQSAPKPPSAEATPPAPRPEPAAEVKAPEPTPEPAPELLEPEVVEVEAVEETEVEVLEASPPAPPEPAPKAEPAPAARPAAPKPTPKAAKSRRGSGGIDALAELEKIREQALKPRKARKDRNGREEISRDVKLRLSRDDFKRARRFSVLLKVEDAESQIVDEVHRLEVDIANTASLEKVLLRLNIALDASS